jgi:hypothetical protein
MILLVYRSIMRGTRGAIQNHNQTVGMLPEIIGQISTDLDLACCNGR